MRKIMLMCSLFAFALCSSVGSASNAAKIEKPPTVLVIDCPSHVDLVAFEQLILAGQADLLVMNETLSVEAYLLKMPPVAVLANPVCVPDLKSDYLSFKETKRFKNKYHAEHLFNPVKLC